MGNRADLSFDLGEDWVINLSCNLADGVTPLDLTGATVSLIVGTVASPLLTAPGTVGTPSTGGTAVFHVTPAQQSVLSPGSYPFTVRATLADGSISDQAFGSLKLRAA